MIKPLEKPVFLYVKTHRKTGLKYFGKTTKNPYTYKGSGHYWKRHIKLHGNDIETEVLGVFYDEESLTAFALDFSRTNNIVQSDEWANLIEENGLDGGNASMKSLQIKWSPARRAKFSRTVEGRQWYNNGTEQVLAKEAPEGWVRGRLPFSEERNRKVSLKTKGRSMSEEDKAKRRKPKANKENYKWTPPRVVCRLSDRKEMTLRGFGTYLKSLEPAWRASRYSVKP